MGPSTKLLWDAVLTVDDRLHPATNNYCCRPRKMVSWWKDGKVTSLPFAITVSLFVHVMSDDREPR